jgi:hypothetical protein
MTYTALSLGILCIIAAIVGGNVTLAGQKVPTLKPVQSVLLGLFGGLCLLAWYRPTIDWCKIPGLCADRGKPLFVGLSDNCNRGEVAITIGQKACSNKSIGFTIKDAKDKSHPLYWGTIDGKNRGMVTGRSGNFRAGDTELYGYIYGDNPIRSGTVQLFMITGGTARGCAENDGMVTTADKQLGCTTDPVGWTVP